MYVRSEALESRSDRAHMSWNSTVPAPHAGWFLLQVPASSAGSAFPSRARTAGPPEGKATLLRNPGNSTGFLYRREQ